MPLFEPLAPDLDEVVNSIQTKVRGLPNFQRDFTWPPDMVRDLLISVIQQYPVGSLLEIRYVPIRHRDVSRGQETPPGHFSQ